MAIALIALGANLPSDGRAPEQTLALALDLLSSQSGIAVIRRSWWFRTPAFPPGSGPDFINAAAALETDLSPPGLLETLQGVEEALGRERRARWAPRPCDLDLLALGDTVLPDPATLGRWMTLAPEAAALSEPEGIVLPHPRLQERAFVLVPLADVAPDWRHPLSGQTVAGMVAALPEADRAAVVAIEPVPPGP